MLKHFLALKTIIANFVAFFVSFRNCNILHSQDVVLGHFGKTGVYAGHCIVSLSTSQEVDNVHLSEIANQSDCLKYQLHRVCIC